MTNTPPPFGLRGRDQHQSGRRGTQQYLLTQESDLDRTHVPAPNVSKDEPEHLEELDPARPSSRSVDSAASEPPDGAGNLGQTVVEVNENLYSSRVHDLSAINYLLECWCGDMDTFGEAWVLGPEGNRLVYSLTYRPSRMSQSDKLRSFEASAPHESFRVGESIPGMAWQQAKVVWMDLSTVVDDPHHHHFNKRLHLARELFTTFVAVPLYGEGKQLAGVVVAYFPTRLSPEGTTMRYLRAMADLTAPLAYFMELRKGFQSGSRERVRRNFARVRDVLRFAGPARLAQIQQEAKHTRRATRRRKHRHKAQKKVTTYTGKMMGGKPAMPPRMAPREAALTWFGVFITISIIGLLQKFIEDAGQYRGRSSYIVMTGSFGALATLVFAVPSAPLAQPRVIITSHIFATCVALAVYHIFRSHELWLQGGLAVATAIAGMALLGITHPPAGAASLAFIIGTKPVHEEGPFFLVTPVLLGCTLHIIIGIAVNNLSSKRRYPTFW